MPAHNSVGLDEHRGCAPVAPALRQGDPKQPIGRVQPGPLLNTSHRCQSCVFLTNDLQQIAAADFFVVATATFRLLFVLVILAHIRRRVVHVAVTDHRRLRGRRSNSSKRSLVRGSAISAPPS